MGGADLDMVQRDPNDLNRHVQVCFDEIFGEPQGVQSIDCIWRCSYTCFECTKSFCYKLMTTLCGCCIAFAWGCDFALTAFNHVWIFTPCLRDLSIAIGCAQKVFGTIINCCCVPICEACAICFSKIKVAKI